MEWSPVVKTLLLIFVVIFIGILYEGARVGVALVRGKEIIEQTQKFQQTNNTPAILIAGDSTGFGTGADQPERSIAGRIVTTFDRATIENVSENGARVHEVTAQLVEARQKQYDLVLLQMGGNNVLNFYSLERTRVDTRAAFEAAQKLSDTVVFMSHGDIGNAPAFGLVLSHLYSKRTYTFREMFIKESEQAGITYVDLYFPKDSDPFFLEPLKYHAADGVHPSGAGYGVWYRKLEDILHKLL